MANMIKLMIDGKEIQSPEGPISLMPLRLRGFTFPIYAI